MADKSMKLPRRYLSYLLRLWRENDDDSPLWRVSLERPQDDERLVFASLKELFVFLEVETRSSPPDSQYSGEDEK